jgi:hypothetical protein
MKISLKAKKIRKVLPSRECSAQGWWYETRRGTPMKINFIVNKCDNPAIVWTIREALEARGFKVIDCGFGIGPMAGIVDLECDPPIDFADAVPPVVLEIAAGELMPPKGTS